MSKEEEQITEVIEITDNDLDTGRDLVTENYGLEILTLKDKVDLRRFSRSFLKVDKLLKSIFTGKEDKFSKNSGFNKEKTDEEQNDTNKLFTALGALNLKNWLITNYTTLMNNIRDNLNNSINTKLNHGGYNGNAQDIVNMINSLNICPYRVGDILKTTSNISPAISWVGTTWKKIEGRFLMGTTGNDEAGGIGGASEVRLSVAHMPAHGHGISITLQANGGHRHKVDEHIHGQPPHTHEMPLCFGYNGGSPNRPAGNSPNGGSYPTHSAGGENTGSASPYTSFEPEHSHSVSASITETGTGQSFSIVPPYYKVHIWERLS